MNARPLPSADWTEMITRLGAMPAFVAAALEEAGPERLQFNRAPDEFSLVEQACHLRDLEREGYLLRIRRMLNEKEPALEPFDGGAVAKARDYRSQDARAAADDFAAARGELLALVAALSPADLARPATFEGERITLAKLIAMVDAHDAGHRDEVNALLEALRSR